VSVRLYACRVCEVELGSDTSCDVCGTFKDMIVVMGDLPAPRAPSKAELAIMPPDLLPKQSALTMALLNDLEAQRKSPDGWSAGDCRTLLATGQTLAKLLDAYRKVEADKTRQAAGLSVDEQTDLFLTEFFAKLAPDKRAEIVAAVTAMEGTGPGGEPH